MTHQAPSNQPELSIADLGDPQAGNLSRTRRLAPTLLPLAKQAGAACYRYETRRYEADVALEARHHDAPPATDELILWTDSELQTDLALVKQVQQTLARRPEQLDPMARYCDFGLANWVSACVFHAANNGHLPTALALFDGWDQLTPTRPAEQLGSRALLLLGGGRREEAQAAAQIRLDREPEGLAALKAAAHVYQQCGDLEAAEHCGRRYVAVTRRDNSPELCFALDALAQILRQRGREEEACALEAEAAALPLVDDIDDLNDDDDDDYGWQLLDQGSEHRCRSCGELGHLHTQPLPVVRSKPKIGRNQPCPCGSGAKHKKCCGR